MEKRGGHSGSGDGRVWRRGPVAAALVLVLVTGGAALANSGASIVLAGYGGGGPAQWTSLGPQPIRETANLKDNSSGRVTAIVVDPNNASHLYTGGLGGVWRSFDAGASWTPASNPGEMSPAIGALALDAAGRVYAGTGVGADTQLGKGRSGNGIFFSNDGGMTWSPTGSGNAIFQGHAVQSLVVDQSVAGTAPQVLLAAGDFGLFRSTDSGATWTNVTPLGIGASQPVWKVVQDPEKPSDFWAVGNRSDCEGQVFKSTDSGATWTSGLIIGSQGAGAQRVGNTNLNPFRESIAIAKSNVWVSASDCAGYQAQPHAFFWTGTGSNPGSFNTTDNGADPYDPGQVQYGQGSYDNVLYMDPNDECMAYVGGVWLQRYANNDLNPLSSCDAFASPARFPNLPGGIVDWHAAAYAGSQGKFYLGGDQGLFLVDDSAKGSTPSVTPLNGSSPATALGTTLLNGGDATSTGNGSVIVAASQDNAAIPMETVGAGPFAGSDENRGAGDSGFATIGSASPQSIYVSQGYFTNAQRFDTGTLTNGTDISVCSHLASTPSQETQSACQSEPSLFFAPFLVDAANPGHVVTATDALWETSTAGPNNSPQWTRHATSPLFLPFFGSNIDSDCANFGGGSRASLSNGEDCFSAIALDSASTSINRATMLGSDMGRVWLRTGVDEFCDVTTGLPAPEPESKQGPWISSVALRSTGNGTFEGWVAIDSVNANMPHLYHSSSLSCPSPGGANPTPGWAALDTPSLVGATSLVFDPADLSILFEGTTDGVNECIGCTGPATNPHISPVGVGLPRVWVNDLTISHDELDLIAWTWGRGAWAVPLPPTVTDVNPSLGPVAGGTSVTITGANFSGVTAVEFGSNSAAFTFNSVHSITAISPPGGAGIVDVTVTTPGGGSTHNSNDHFTYVQPPEVVTEKPSSIGQTGATLLARVNPNGETVSDCHFEYGPTTLYGVSLPCESLPGSGTSPVGVSAVLEGLSANSTSHYRIVATNPGGTSYGGDQTLTTLPNPPTVVPSAASSVTQTTATLHATVNPEGGNVTECKFEYGTNLSYGSSVPCSALPGSGTSPVAVSAAASGLKIGTGYFVRISATNSSGTSKSSFVYFKTLEPAVTINPPTEITASTATFHAIVNPGGSNVTNCTFEYGTNLSYGSSVACSALPGSGTSPVAVSAPASGLKAGTGYFVRISETNGKGTSQSTYAYFKTLETPVVIQAPTEIAATTATFHALVNPGGSNVTKCTFEYGTNLSYGSSVSCSSLPGSGTSPVAVSAAAGGLKAGTGYFVRISETNGKGTAQSTYVYFKTLETPVLIQAPGEVTKTTATFHALVNPGGSNVTNCTFEYGTNLSYGSSVSCSSLPGSGTSPVAVSAPVSGLKAATGYFVRISETNGKGTAQSTYYYFKTLA